MEKIQEDEDLWIEKPEGEFLSHIDVYLQDGTLVKNVEVTDYNYYTGEFKTRLDYDKNNNNK